MIKYTFRHTSFRTVFLVSVCLLVCGGCRSKKDDRLANKETIAFLQQQVSDLQSQVISLKEDLRKERAKTASPVSVNLSSQLAEKRLNDPNIPEQPSPEIIEDLLKNAVAQLIEQDVDGKLSSQADLLVDSLREENERLVNEVQRLEALFKITNKDATSGEGEDENETIISAIVLTNEWQNKRNPVQKIQFLESLQDLSLDRDPELLPIIRQALEDPDPEVGIAASEMLGEYRSSEVLPVIEAALLSSNEQVRLNALQPLTEINDPQVPELLNTAFNDSSEDVRNEALEIAAAQEGDVQLQTLAAGMKAGYEQVKTEALSLLELRGDHQTVPVIMAGLDDPDPAFRQEVNAALSFLIDQEFSNQKDAVNWWNANKDRYDENLFEK